jgi:TM2 domain-containing membrane protein YozV
MDNLLLKRDLSAEQLAMVQSELDKQAKSKGVMYLLWWFTGGIGGHRYYLGDIGMGIAMTLTLGGLGVWSLIDVFLIGKRLEKKTNELEFKLIQKVKSMATKAV